MIRKITAILLTTLLMICCFVGVVSAAYGDNLITNGDFSTGSLSGWTYSSNPASGTANIVAASTGGTTCALFKLAVPTTVTDVPTTSISQSVDLTNVQQITWKTKQWTKSTSGTAYNLIIYKDDSPVAYYTYSQLGTDWTTRTYDVSSITGQVTIKFEGTVNGYEGSASSYLGFYLTDITALDQYIDPFVTSVNYQKSGSTTTTPAYSTGETVTVAYVFSAGSSSSASASINWGDSSTSTLSTGSNTVTHTYSSVGSYQPQITVKDGSSTVSTSTLSTVYIIGLDFTASSVSVAPDTQISFTINPTLPSSVDISSYVWNYGDGSEQTASNYHTYSSAGTYTVSLTVTLTAGSGYTVSKTKTSYITVAEQTIAFSNTQVEYGQSVTVSWNLRETNYPYILNIYPSYNTGIKSSNTAVRTHTINSASDTSYTFIGNLSPDYYSAYIEKSGSVITYTERPVNLVTLITFTVIVNDNGVAYLTDNATVKLYNASGTLLNTKSTVAKVSNSVSFGDIPTGEYYVTIEAPNQTLRTSQTLQLTDVYTLTMDFTLGSSSTSTTGVGSQYSTTFVTFRTQDSGTGRYISGVNIVATAVQPTNAWEYFANLFGASLGTVIQSMTLSGQSDHDGRLTFAMYQNVRYNLYITYENGGEKYEENRSFQQSTLSGEYLITIPVTDLTTHKITEELVTAVNISGNDIITNFTDYSGTVSKCIITVYKKNGDNRTEIENSSITYYNPVIGSPHIHTFSPADPAGNSYIVSFVMTSSLFGNKTQEYGVTFSGVAIKLGDIPNDWYIWISFGILLMTGAVATFVNSRHFAIVVCIVATLLYFAGWLNALGAVAPIAIVICYVLTIVYYIANNHNGGGY